MGLAIGASVLCFVLAGLDVALATIVDATWAVVFIAVCGGICFGCGIANAVMAIRWRRY